MAVPEGHEGGSEDTGHPAGSTAEIVSTETTVEVGEEAGKISISSIHPDSATAPLITEKEHADDAESISAPENVMPAPATESHIESQQEADPTELPSEEPVPEAQQSEDASGSTTEQQKEDEFVPPDMEHIVSTGAAEDGASSMEALRDLVAKARETSGQTREALPPGFDDAETEFAPSQVEEGGNRKRKAEVELERLMEDSKDVEEVQRVIEKTQDTEAKSLLQKAFSSISGLISRKGKEPASSKENRSIETDGLESEEESDSDSESESSSSSSSEEDSDEDDEGNEGQPRKGLAIGVEDYDDDDEGGGGSSNAIPATKNEITAPEVDLPPVQELSEEDRATVRMLGRVHSIVDNVVVIEQDVHRTKTTDGQKNDGSGLAAPIDSTGQRGEGEGEYSVLDTGSLLCFEDGTVLGLVFETFGSIHSPLYSIRFPSAASIDKDTVQIGKPVFYLPRQSTYVMTRLLRAMKGSDASNMWDEEVAEDEIEYSDDEAEAEAKRRAKAVRAGKVDENGNPLPNASNKTNKRQKQANYPNQPYNQQQQQQQTRKPLPRQPLPPHPNGHNATMPSQLGRAPLPAKPPSSLPARPSFDRDAPTSTSPVQRQILSYAETEIEGDVSANGTSSVPRTRTSTADSSVGGGRSRLPSAAALPPKPTAAAVLPATAHRRQGSITAASPPRPAAALASAKSALAPAGPTQSQQAMYPNQPPPIWYGSSGNPSAPPSAAAPYVAAGASDVQAQSGHYNPRFAAYWQQQQHQHQQQQQPQPAPHQQHPQQQPRPYPQYDMQQQYYWQPMQQQPHQQHSPTPYGSMGGYTAPEHQAPQWRGYSQPPQSQQPGHGAASSHVTQVPPHQAAGSYHHHHYQPQQQQNGAYSAYQTPTAASTGSYGAYGYGPPGSQPIPSDSYDPRSSAMRNATPSAPKE